MIILFDIFVIIVALVFTGLLYMLYYKIFIIGYINKIIIIKQNSETERFEKLMNNAISKQPKKMEKLLNKYKIK